MMILQLSKLGLLVPDFGLPNNVKSKLQTLWANNGDIISKQYAGTNALKVKQLSETVALIEKACLNFNLFSG